MPLTQLENKYAASLSIVGAVSIFFTNLKTSDSIQANIASAETTIKINILKWDFIRVSNCKHLWIQVNLINKLNQSNG